MADLEVRSGIWRLRFWGRLVCLFLPLWLSLGALCWELACHHYEAAVAGEEASAVLHVTQGHKLILAHTASVFSDLLLTAYAPGIHAWAQDPTADVEAKRLLLALSHEKPAYDQIRLFDMAGKECIRVNRRGSDVELAAESDLQNKSKRYYFEEAKALEVGEVFVSRIDLNVEHGQIVVPYEPTIRFATQVTDQDGEVAGILLINFRVDAVLSQIGQVSESFKGEIQLLDRDSYWLKAENPADEWGFMFPARESERLATRCPELWQHISGAAMGSVKVPQGHGYWQRIQVMDSSGHHNEGLRRPLELVILGFIDNERLASIWREGSESYLLLFIVSSVLLLAGCVSLTVYHDRLMLHRRHAHLLERASQEAPWGAMLIDDDRQVLWISDPLCNSLGHAAAELEGRACDGLILLDASAAVWEAIRQGILANGQWQGDLKLNLKPSAAGQSSLRAVVSPARPSVGEAATAYFILFPDLAAPAASAEQIGPPRV